MATATAKRVPPILDASPPLANFVVAISLTIIPASPVIPTAALPMPSHDIPEIILATPANIPMATATAKRVPPILDASPPLANFVVAISLTIIPASPVIPTAALPMPSHDIFESILATFPSTQNTPAIDKSVRAILLALAPRSPLINKEQMAITAIIVKAINFKPMSPLSACSGSIFPSFLTTEANTLNSTATDKSVRAILLALAPCSPLVNKEHTIITSSMVNTNASKPMNPTSACSGFIDPIFLTTEASTNSEIAIINIAEYVFCDLRPSFDIESDVFDNKVATTDNARSIPANAPITPTACHNSSGSASTVKRIIAPTNIARDIAKSFIPFAACSNAIAFKSFEKLLTTLATLLRIFFIFPADFFIIFPVDSNMLPAPPSGLAMSSKAFDILLNTTRKPVLIPVTNTWGQSTFPRKSIILEVNFFKVSHNVLDPSLIPFTKPCTKLRP